jgi:hypothetical protein
LFDGETLVSCFSSPSRHLATIHHVLLFIFFRGEKEEAQLSSAVEPPQQKPHIIPQPAFTKNITRTVARPQPKPFMPQQSIANKKSLVVNGNINGHAVKTSISRERIEQHGLHL